MIVVEDCAIQLFKTNRYAFRTMTPNAFEHLVVKAIDTLPNTVINALDNVAICIEDDSPDGDCLGEYIGISQIERGNDYAAALPDKIVLYRLAILDAAGEDPRAIEEEIRRTLWHELAHHFGWSDDVLERVEQQKGW